MRNKMIRVVGDIMLDEWVNGNLEKKSAEAPINIFERKRKTIVWVVWVIYL